MLSEFKAGDKVRHTVVCRVQKVGTSSNGGVFARGTVSDNSAVMPFICFEGAAVDALRALTGPAPFVVTGTIDINKFAGDGSLQIMLQKAENPQPYDDLSHLLPDGGVDLPKYERELRNLLTKITDPLLKKFLQSVFSGELYQSFRANPAGMSYHHAYVGGLIEHSVDVAVLAVAMGETVKDVDLDLLIAGSLLHDVGKLREISSDIGFPYTDEGKLAGHITLGILLISEAAAKLDKPPSKEKWQALLHIMLSHHGEPEKGSPLPCKTKEAFIVHYADELDSIMNQFRRPAGSGWQYSKMLSRNIYVDPTGRM
jgi:3'-5' exoribonuclease